MNKPIRHLVIAGAAALAFAALAGTPLAAQQAFDARSAAMAFSSGADARGLEQVGLNPAALALPMRKPFELNLLSASVSVHNNSFKKSQYDKYFTTGDVLTAEDKDAILASIDDKGLRADLLARVNTLAFAMQNFSLSVVGMGVGTLNIPKDVFELPLNGNGGQGRRYNIDDADGVDWAGLGVFASGAYPLPVSGNGTFRFAAVGLTAKYISGFAYHKITRADAELLDFSDDRDRISLNGEFEAVGAEGGSGFGIDLGGIAGVGEKLTVGMTLLNVASRMRWEDTVERVQWSVREDSIAFPGVIDDSVLVGTDTTFAIDGVTSHLPVVLDLAAAYTLNPQVLLTAEYEQGITRDMGGTTRSRLAVGVEYKGLAVLPLRAGINLGGKLGAALALGMGIDLPYWFLDVAVINHGRLIPGDYKGLSVGVTTRFRF